MNNAPRQRGAALDRTAPLSTTATPLASCSCAEPRGFKAPELASAAFRDAHGATARWSEHHSHDEWLAIVYSERAESERLQYLALTDPAEYQRLLQSFFLLLGEDRPWWRRCLEADDPRWPSCVRGAIATIAREQGIPARMAADYLDADDCPRTRQRALELARKALYDQGAA